MTLHDIAAEVRANRVWVAFALGFLVALLALAGVEALTDALAWFRAHTEVVDVPGGRVLLPTEVRP